MSNITKYQKTEFLNNVVLQKNKISKMRKPGDFGEMQRRKEPAPKALDDFGNTIAQI